MLNNLNNYYIYADFVKNPSFVIKSSQIDLANWRSHYTGIFNILRDGIELKELHKKFITIQFDTDDQIDLTVDDYLLNLIMWYPIIAIGNKIQPYHIIFKKYTKSGDIKKYIDKFFIIPNRSKIDSKILNNVISDTLCPFLDLDEFALFFANTLNLEDDIELMDASPEYNSLIHCDLSNVPVEYVKDEGMKIVSKAVQLILKSKEIMGHEHCLKNPFAAGEGINKKQYRENHYNIGTKPDGQGSIFHEIINQSYITGGLNNFTNEFIDCATARVAQIISKKNVGESGGFSRILGLNNIDTWLNPDPTYSCNTKNLIPITIQNDKILNRMKYRTYRLHKEGQEFELDPNDTSLIGKRLWFRSPITCSSYAHGFGVCHACYGRALASINQNINIGRIATEIVTEQYTQMRLSAKHLLETLIEVINWCEEFDNFFNVDINIIRLASSFAEDENVKNPLEGWILRIREDDVMLENDDDFFKHLFYSDDAGINDEANTYNEYLNEFTIISPKGDEFAIHSEPKDENDSPVKLFISKDLNNIIRSLIKKSKEEYIDEDNGINIPMKFLQEKDLFTLKIQNNDLGKALDVFTDLINKKNVTKSFTIPQLTERIQMATINGNINVDSIHLEIMLANQIRDALNRLERPDWDIEDIPYEVLTLNEALTDHPSPIVSVLYQKLVKVLYYPLTYNKQTPSIFDILFMRKPKKYLEADHEIWDTNRSTRKPGECPVMFIKDHSGPRPRNMKEYVKRFRAHVPKTELDD